MIWLAIWAAGVPIAYILDNDPTGTLWDRFIGAAVWPLVVLVIGAMLIVGGACMLLNIVRR